MESTRRPLDRSLSRESGLKKPRLAEDIAPSNGRARFIQRPSASNSGGGSRVRRDLDSESSDSVRGPYQNQTGQQLHQELVNQYKTALAELTFNSKPIITNLTIIAGENLHAAKAIAATVCANILEVPREQKLPSLYLLDSIVKNIGKDYIKYFGSRLPEVFCKAYRQVDPSTHPGMRHLFGTWEGVFPPQALQIIESELGFATSANGSSSGATTSRPDPQTQCPAHSIHVNPKYLEARQRLQTPKDLDSYPRRPQNMHETGSRLENEASVDSMSAKLGQVASGTRVPLSWSKDLFLQEERRFSQSGNNISGYSEEYSTVSRSSANSLARTPLKSPVGSNQIGTPSSKYSANVVPGLKASTTRQQHPRGAPVSFARSPIYHPTELQNNFSERNPSSVRPPGLKSRRAQDELSQDSLPLPSRDLYGATQRFQPPSLLASSAPTPRLQQRKQVSSSQQRKPEVLEFEFSEGQKLLPLQSSMAESQSTPGHSSSDHSNPLTIDSPGLSITSSLLSDVAKSGIFGSSASATKSDLRVGTELSQVQPSLSNDPPADISSSSPVHGNMFLPGSSQKKLKQPPLPAGPPSSVADIGSGKKQIAANSASNPVFSLLSSLGAKGLISTSKSDSQLSTPTEKPEQPLDRGSGVASTSLTPFSSVPITATPPASSSADDPSSLRPITHSTDDFAESTTKIKNLIGFEFKPNVIRNLNPDVITELVSELPRRCSICGLRLKLQEHLDRHMEWHSLRHPDQNPSSSASRKWYVNATDWVAGNCEPLPDTLSDMEESIETLESKEQMVLADESQCACILCGELFEDFYCVERKEWMFKGAIYSTVPLSESLEKIGTTTDTASLGPIVHANCISEVPVHEFGRVNDVKSEEGA